VLDVCIISDLFPGDGRKVGFVEPEHFGRLGGPQLLLC
jgi:hypothetical protein